MLGSKKGIRDINRGVSDMSNGVAEMKIAAAKTPERALELMEQQRDRAYDQSLKHQAKAKGMFTGPAELRAAKAAEGQANQWQRRIDKLIKKNPHLKPVENAPASTDDRPASTGDRLAKLKDLLDQGHISEKEYAAQRETIIGQV